MLNYIALISLISILYAYFGYFFLLSYLSKKKKNMFVPSDLGVTESLVPTSITIIIAAKNEEKHIEEKIINTLSLKAWDRTAREELLAENPRIQVIVADDSSTDLTAEIVKQFESVGVLLSTSNNNLGKEGAQKQAALLANNDIVLFTDTKVSLNELAINNTLKYFLDASVGAVSSTDFVIDETNSSGEGAYVKYEMKLRELESEVYSLVGLSGSCFAVRRQISSMIEHGIPSDFSLLMQAVKFGYRGVIATDVIGSYKAVQNIDKEFKRKVRTVLRGMTALAKHTEILDFSKYGFFSVQVISHKLYRWLVPWFFITLFVSTYFLSSCSGFWELIFSAQLILLLLAACGKILPETVKYLPVKISLFFVASNLGIFLAGVKLLQGAQIASWEPSRKG